MIVLMTRFMIAATLGGGPVGAEVVALCDGPANLGGLPSPGKVRHFDLGTSSLHGAAAPDAGDSAVPDIAKQNFYQPPDQSRSEDDEGTVRASLSPKGMVSSRVEVASET